MQLGVDGLTLKIWQHQSGGRIFFFFFNWENTQNTFLCIGQKVFKIIKKGNYTLLWSFLVKCHQDDYL